MSVYKEIRFLHHNQCDSYKLSRVMDLIALVQIFFMKMNFSSFKLIIPFALLEEYFSCGFSHISAFPKFPHFWKSRVIDHLKISFYSHPQLLEILEECDSKTDHTSTGINSFFYVYPFLSLFCDFSMI